MSHEKMLSWLNQPRKLGWQRAMTSGITCRMPPPGDPHIHFRLVEIEKSAATAMQS